MLARQRHKMPRISVLLVHPALIGVRSASMAFVGDDDDDAIHVPISGRSN
jgi:hypothetical protein